MTEIKYYPLIDCDTEGTEKVAMISSIMLPEVRMRWKTSLLIWNGDISNS